MEKVKFLSLEVILLTMAMLFSGCINGDKVNKKAAGLIPEESQKFVDSQSKPECSSDSTCAENDKLTGVWLLTTTGKATESGEKSSDSKGQKLVLIKAVENHKVSIESCDPFDIFSDPLDPAYKIVSGAINEERPNAVGNIVTFKLSFKNNETASGSMTFTEGSYVSREAIEAVKVSESSTFEKKGSDSINLSVLVAENKSVITGESNFAIDCYSLYEDVTYYIYSEKKQVNVTINGKDRVVAGKRLSVQGIDVAGNELLLDMFEADYPVLLPNSIFTTYTDVASGVIEVEFFNPMEEVNGEIILQGSQYTGGLDIGSDNASVDVVADDGEGASATFDFSLNYP